MCVYVPSDPLANDEIFFKQGLIGIWNVTVLALYILLSQNDDIIKYRKWKQTMIIVKILKYWNL